jgi:hypothetical protein
LRVIESVSLSVVQQHELATGANINLGGYHMDRCCPLPEFRTFKVALDSDDIDRLFILWDFAQYTAGHTCQLKDVLPLAESEGRVAPFIRDAVDLRTRHDRAIQIVSDAETGRPLVVIDGNHRAIAQYLMYRTVHDVPAFLCIHPKIGEWSGMPPSARGSVK